MGNSNSDLRLSFRYSRPQPGQEGISELRVHATGLTVTFTPDLTMPGSSPRKIGEFEPGGWRGIVAAINTNQAYALHTTGTAGEYPWPWAIDCEGPRNFASELIVLAWAGPPLSDFALGMMAATDEQLAAMHRQAGSFLRELFVRRAVDLQERANEIGIPLNELVARRHGAPLDLSAIYQDVAEIQPAEPPPNATRQSLAIVLGSVLAIGGGWFSVDLLMAGGSKKLLLGSGFVMTIGCYLLWETLRDWNKSRGRQ